jgi:hypothetical protein
MECGCGATTVLETVVFGFTEPLKAVFGSFGNFSRRSYDTCMTLINRAFG